MRLKSRKQVKAANREFWKTATKPKELTKSEKFRLRRIKNAKG